MGGWAPPGPRRGYATAMPHRQVLPPKATSSLSQSSSPAQRELPQNSEAASLLPLSNRAAPRSAGAPPEAASSLRPWSSVIAPRSGSSPRSSHFSPSTEQPRRAAGAPPEASASSLSQSSSSPAQRELPQKQPPLSLYQAAPRSGSSPRSSHRLLSVHGAAPPRSGSSPRSISLLPLSIEQQPCAAGAPPRSSLFSPSMEQLRAEGAPPEAASSLPLSALWSSPAQRELPQKQPLLSLYRLIEQPRAAAGAPPEAASSLSQSSSPAQRELPQK